MTAITGVRLIPSQKHNKMKIIRETIKPETTLRSERDALRSPLCRDRQGSDPK